ncbi:hypothetical protein ACG7TL_004238 [Trametes sanguinea]
MVRENLNNENYSHIIAVWIEIRRTLAGLDSFTHRNMEDTTPAGKPIVDREKTAPFLIRTFIKIGTFHRLQQFEDGPLPLADEQQIYTWKDATLREVLTTLRSTAPNSTEYRHPLARYSFRAVFVDAAARGRFAHKELGTVYSRDILGEPGSLDHPAPRLLEDGESEAIKGSEQDRTLDELRFVPGDYLCVAVHLPKGVTMPAGPGVPSGPAQDLVRRTGGKVPVDEGMEAGVAVWLQRQDREQAEVVDTGEVTPDPNLQFPVALVGGVVEVTLEETETETTGECLLPAGTRLPGVMGGADDPRLGLEVLQGGGAGTTESLCVRVPMYL